MSPWVEMDEYGEVEKHSSEYLKLAAELGLHPPSPPPATKKNTQEKEPTQAHQHRPPPQNGRPHDERQSRNTSGQNQSAIPTACINEVFRNISASLTQRNLPGKAVTHPKGRAKA